VYLEAEHSRGEVFNGWFWDLVLVSHKEEGRKRWTKEGSIDMALWSSTAVHVLALRAEQVHHSLLWFICEPHLYGILQVPDR
jgi:hypothetical protein